MKWDTTNGQQRNIAQREKRSEVRVVVCTITCEEFKTFLCKTFLFLGENCNGGAAAADVVCIK